MKSNTATKNINLPLMHKKIRYILRYAALVLLMAGVAVSCSDVAEDERLVYVRPADVRRAVLIEDFTGQRCVWCPNGNDAIDALEQQYGDTTIIAVAVHSGPLGFKGNAAVVGLATELGDTYYNRFGVESQPTAYINRRALLPRVTDWPARVLADLEAEPALMLTLTAGYDSLTRHATLQTDILALDHDVDGFLQVWLTEDSIRALQMMPDGSANAGYIHNHVLRAAVNGDWGEPVSVAAHQSVSRSCSYTLPAEYNARHCHFVAFVYSDDGVLQAAKVQVAPAKEPSAHSKGQASTSKSRFPASQGQTSTSKSRFPAPQGQASTSEN